MNEFVIREVRRDELEDCARLIRESFGTVAKEFHLTVQNCPTNGAFTREEHLAEDYDNGNQMYVLLTGAELAGFAQLAKKHDACFELKKLAVLPRCRHMGYGAELITFVRNQVSELGGTKITIGIIEENTRLKDWYLSHGFVHTGTRAFAHLPFVAGFMELALDGRSGGGKE